MDYFSPFNHPPFAYQIRVRRIERNYGNPYVFYEVSHPRDPLPVYCHKLSDALALASEQMQFEGF